MKETKRVLSLLLAGCLLIGCLAGCSNSSSDTTTVADATAASDTTAASGDTAAATEAESTEAEPTEPVVITIGINGLGSGHPENVEDDFIRTTILEAINVQVDLVNIDDYYTALNLALIGGSAPDFFYCDYDHMKEYADQELIQPLTEYKDDMAAVFEYLGEEYDNFTLYVDDEMYATPKGATENYYGLYMRQDILDAYGVDEITNVDDLYDFLVQAVADDATGTGATFGLGGALMYPYDLIASTYGTLFGNYIIIEDGEVTNTLFSPYMEEALTVAKKFWDAGIVSPNTFTSSTGTVEIREGKTIVGVAKWASLLKQAYVDVLHTVNPDAELVLCQPLEASVEGVETFIAYNDYNFNSGAKVCVNAETSEEKIEAYIKLINYLASEEGMMLSWMGIQGTHWDYDANGNAVVLEGQDDKINYIHSYQLIGRNDLVYCSTKFPEADFAMEYNVTVNRLTVYNNTIDVPTTLYVDDMEDYIYTGMIAFIKGDRPISEYSDFLQELYSIYDLQTYMDVAVEQLTEMGLLN